MNSANKPDATQQPDIGAVDCSSFRQASPEAKKLADADVADRILSYEQSLHRQQIEANIELAQAQARKLELETRVQTEESEAWCRLNNAKVNFVDSLTGLIEDVGPIVQAVVLEIVKGVTKKTNH